MSFGQLGENAVLLGVFQPGAAAIDTHGNATTAGLVSVWTGSAPCHLRERIVIQQAGAAEKTVTSVRQTSLIVRLSRAPNAAQLVLSGWEQNASRIQVSDQRTTPSVIRTYRVVVSAVRSGGGALLDSIRLDLEPSVDA